MNDETGKFSSDSQLQFQHPYPATKIMFIPDKEGNCPDLVATTGDYLRIWQLTEEGTTLQKLLNNVSSSPCRQSCDPSQRQVGHVACHIHVRLATTNCCLQRTHHAIVCLALDLLPDAPALLT